MSTKRAVVMTVAALAGGTYGCRPPDPVAVDVTPPSGRFASALSLDTRIEARAGEPTRALPPITGGTLHVAARDVLVVSDPLRDRVVFVDLVSSRVMGEVSLPEGAFPARIAEDASGRVHVVLRGTGEVLTVHPRDLASARRHEVCAAPRGIAYDPEGDVLLVGCRDGSLDTLSTDGTLVSRVSLGIDDIRDVLVVDDRFYVTTFRSAEVHQLDRDLHVLSTVAPSTRHDSALLTGETVDFLPEVAWRTIVSGNELVMVHQRGAERVVAAPTTPAYYGNGFSCGCPGLRSVVPRFVLRGGGRVVSNSNSPPPRGGPGPDIRFPNRESLRAPPRAALIPFITFSSRSG